MELIKFRRPPGGETHACCPSVFDEEKKSIGEEKGGKVQYSHFVQVESGGGMPQPVSDDAGTARGRINFRKEEKKCCNRGPQIQHPI